MNTKSIIISVLSVIGAVAMTGCSKDTIWEEISYGQETPSYSNGELPVTVTVHKDRADVTLYKDLTYYIYLDGVFIKKLTNEKKVTMRALTPNTDYHLHIIALEYEKVLTKDVAFTTLKSYATVIGWREMDPYGNNEEEVKFVHQIPGGDFLDVTCKYLDYAFDNLRLRRTDAEGKVTWRSKIGVDDASVSEEGNIAAWSYDMACRVNPETGDVLYNYTRKTDDYLINGAYACKDGGMAVVGRNNNEGKYYFARIDANGQLVHEEEGDLADELCDVHEIVDGSVVAMGKKGEKSFVAITFDAEGNVVGESTDSAENRDLDNRAYFKQSIRDNKGNTYFLGGGEVVDGGSYGAATIIVKVDVQGKMVWTHTLSDKHDEFYSTSMLFMDDDKLCVSYSGKSTHVAFITSDNELLQDVAFNGNYNAVYAWPVNEEYTQFIIFDNYGRMIQIDTEGE